MDYLPLALALAVGAVITFVGIKGVPAAWAAVKSWWTKAKTDLSGVKGDLATLEQNVTNEIASLKGRVTTLETAAKAPAPAPAPAPTTAA